FHSLPHIFFDCTHPALAEHPFNPLRIIAPIEHALRKVTRLAYVLEAERITLIQEVVDAAEDIGTQRAIPARLRKHNPRILVAFDIVEPEPDVLGDTRLHHIT